MGFWIFMTFCNLMIPGMMIIIGRVFEKNPPKTINGVYGYRTNMSRKNQDTWDFAHKYCGQLWWKIGWIMLFLAIVAMLPLIGKNDDVVGLWGGVIAMVECVLLIAGIFPVEKALKKNFDKDGNRK